MIYRWPPEPPATVLETVNAALTGPPYFAGDWTEYVEEQMASLVEAPSAVAFPSCSIAIHACLIAYGINHRHARVVAPDFTFIGSVAGALQSKVRLELVDVGDDFCLADHSLDEDVDAVIPVDLHGVPHRWQRHHAGPDHVPVINDACQMLGTRAGGKHVSFHGTHCWSFSPAKAAPSQMGGGAVTTDDDIIAERLRALRDYGRIDGEVMVAGGQNWMPAEAAMVLVSWSLDQLPRWASRMHETGEELRAAAREGGRRVQEAPAGFEVAWHKIRVEGEVEDVTTHRWGRPLHTERVCNATIRQSGGYPVSNAAAEMVCLGDENIPPWTWRRPEIDRAVTALKEWK